jgi:hypothetical protein
MNTPKVLFRRFLRRPGLPGHLLAILWLLLVVLGASNVRANLLEFMGILLGGLALGGLWCLHALLYFFRTAKLAMREPLTRGEIAAWFVLPVITVIALGLWVSRAPLKVRFRLSEPALLAAAEQGRDSGRAGFFHFERRDYDNGLVHLRTCSAGIFDEAGFVNSPAGWPESNWALTYRHFKGHWYTYVWSD